jgi:hypothetical protein
MLFRHAVCSDVGVLLLESYMSVLLLKTISRNMSHIRGRDSVVDVATGYGLDGPRIESRWGRDFPHLYRPAMGLTQPLRQRVPGLSRG